MPASRLVEHGWAARRREKPRVREGVAEEVSGEAYLAVKIGQTPFVRLLGNLRLQLRDRLLGGQSRGAGGLAGQRMEIDVSLGHLARHRPIAGAAQSPRAL